MFSIILLGTSTRCSNVFHHFTRYCYMESFEAVLNLVDLYASAAEFKLVELQRKCEEISNLEPGQKPWGWEGSKENFRGGGGGFLQHFTAEL